MISKEILQKNINQISNISGIDVAVFDSAGFVASNDAEWTIPWSSITEADSTEVEVDGVLYNKVLVDGELAYVVASNADADNASMVGRMAALQIESLIVNNEAEDEKREFYKNLVLGNIFSANVYKKAQNLNISTEEPRCVYIIEIPAESSVLAMDILTNLCDDNDYVTFVDDQTIILIKEMSNADSEDVAESIADTLEADGYIKAQVAFGTVVGELKKVSSSYKEAQTALEVGRIFAQNDRVISYENLGIGRLIYQLPVPLCEMFIREVFKGKSPKDFNEETLNTVEKFFENNLNVSEAARKLYIHRNTLVYRLDKIQEMTGLDLKVLDDAITFKIGMMIVRYLEIVDEKE